MEAAHSPGPSPWRRVLLTLALSLVPVVGVQVPMPGVDFESLPAQLADSPNVSLFALGVSPLLSGYLLVELAALLVPRLRKLRHGLPDGRAHLRRAAVLTAFVLAAFQAFGVGMMLDGLRGHSSAGTPAIPLIMLSAIAATGVLVLAARAIDGLGLVNGIVALTLTSEFTSAPHHFAGAQLPRDPSAIVVTIALYALPVLATWAAVRHFQRSASPGQPLLGGPLSSLRPVVASGSLLTLPSTLRDLHVPGAGALATFIPGPYYYPLLLGVALALTLLLSWLLQLPGRVTRVLNAVEQRDLPYTTTDIQRAVRDGLLPTILLVLTVLFAGALLQGNLRLPDYAFRLALLTALLMDGVHAFALHAKTPGSICVWQERRPYAVPGLIAAAQRAQIQLRASGTAQTSMLRLFGPFAAISLWSAPSDAAAARELLGELLQRANRAPAMPAVPQAPSANQTSPTAKSAKPSTGLSVRGADIYVALLAACLLLVASIAVLWHGPSAESSSPDTIAPTVQANVELLLVDDSADPLADQVEPQLPTGIALFTEDIRFIHDSRHYARLVLQTGESLETARTRLEPWLATLRLPRNERFGWEKQGPREYRSYVLTGSAVFTGTDLQSVQVVRDTDDLSAVTARLHSGAAEIFRRFTSAHQGERMAIVVNHQIITVPIITSEIAGGTLQITSGGHDPESTRESAEALVKELTTPARD